MATALLDDLYNGAEQLHLSPPAEPAPHRHSKQRPC
jgi:hypothetical protein